MATDKTIERVTDELHSALDRMQTDLRRVEILAAALSAFGRPVPDYEPAFQHLHRRQLSGYELGAASGE